MLNRLSLLWRRYSPLEERLFRAVLPEAAQATYDAQVAGVGKVQRSPPSWGEISLYRMRRGRVDWSDVPAFPRTGEFRMADVRFSVGGRRFKSTLTAIQGHIFAFATAPGPRAIAFSSWDEAGRATLLADPMHPPEGGEPGENVPDAWVSLLGQGHAPSDWELHNVQSAYRVAFADGAYLVLAERNGEEFTLSRLEPPSAKLFHLTEHDGVPEALDESPLTVMERGA